MAATVYKNLKPAKMYSKALVELIQDCFKNDGNKFKECANKASGELEFIVKTIQGNSELQNFILNPVISKGDKKDVLNEIFKDSVSERILNFVILLCDNNRLDILSDILSSFKDDINKLQNILPVEITSVIELNAGQKKELIEKLQNKIRAEITPEFRIDETILGGLIIKINDTVVDLSIKKRIENLKIG